MFANLLKRRAWGGAAAVVIAVSLTFFGCGGSDNSTSAQNGASTEQNAAPSTEKEQTSTSKEQTSTSQDETAPPSEQTSASKQAFIKEADKVCEKADKRELAGLESFSKEHKKSGSAKAWEEQLAAAVGPPALQQEAEELGELEPPEGDEEQVEAIVAAIEAGVEDGEANPGNLILPAGENSFAEAEKLAREYGMKVCGEV